MAENLNVDHFRNGDPIPEAISYKDWEQAGENKQPAWCYYYNNPNSEESYGKLYNWYAINDPRGLALKGWHVAYIDEVKTLQKALGNDVVEKMKSIVGWNNNGNGTNESGFSGLPGGYRGRDHSFNNIGNLGIWWITMEYGNESAVYFSLLDDNNVLVIDNGLKHNGLSVRCIKD